MNWMARWSTHAIGAISDQSDRTTHQKGLSSLFALLSQSEPREAWGMPPMMCSTYYVGVAPRRVYGFQRIVSVLRGRAGGSRTG
jgi:hypothetical protein